jgi:hypothetical protein
VIECFCGDRKVAIHQWSFDLCKNNREASNTCDFGYALAANSCEGVTGVDACTATAPRAITAFAASKPRLTPRSAVGFFGSGGRPGHPAQPITQLTSEQLH